VRHGVVPENPRLWDAEDRVERGERLLRVCHRPMGAARPRATGRVGWGAALEDAWGVGGECGKVGKRGR
jgi:hypothetical protein